nr:thiamine pyrophosphate-dependent enzyme [Streptomyces griseus]
MPPSEQGAPYAPNTCLISNGLSAMGFALPGELAVALAPPDVKVLAAVGDGSFLMHSQEIETAVREAIPLTVLIWEDNGYGLIEWKMDLTLGEHHATAFGNPDIVRYAESFEPRDTGLPTQRNCCPRCEQHWTTPESPSSPAPSTTAKTSGSPPASANWTPHSDAVLTDPVAQESARPRRLTAPPCRAGGAGSGGGAL